jgi:CRP/FNR family transcriptional regulator
MIENCADCKLRADGMFCEMPGELLKAFEALRYTTIFPKGAILFIEGQAPRGVFLICTGQVKLSTCASDGKTLITHVAEAGEVLGLSAAISDKPYEVMAETLSPCQINFIKRDDFLTFLAEHSEACLRVAKHMSQDYLSAIEQSRALGLSSSAGRLAELILEWCARKGRPGERGIEIKLTLTHEEIAQMIGASRETITRLFSDFKSQQIIQVRGANLVVCDRSALRAIIHS